MEEERYDIINEEEKIRESTVLPTEPLRSGSEKLNELLRAGVKVSLEEALKLIEDEKKQREECLKVIIPVLKQAGMPKSSTVKICRQMAPLQRLIPLADCCRMNPTASREEIMKEILRIVNEENR